VLESYGLQQKQPSTQRIKKMDHAAKPQSKYSTASVTLSESEANCNDIFEELKLPQQLGHVK